MTTEEEIRETLHTALDGVQGSPDAWDRIQHRLAHRQGSRRVLVGASAVVAGVAVLLGTLAVRSSSEKPQRIDAAAQDAGGSTTRTTPPVPGSGVAGFPGIWPEASSLDYQRASATVAAGAERWRLDPAAVAQTYLVERFSRDGMQMGPFEPFDATTGQVTYRGSTAAGAVIVARPGGEQSPFVVTESASDGLSVVPAGAGSTRGVISAGALRDPLVLEVRGVSGQGTAWAGRFNSEWDAEAPVQVTTATTARVPLAVGTPVPEAMLVRVEVAGVDGLTRSAEFRVDRPGPPGGPELQPNEFLALTHSGVFVIAAEDGSVVRQLIDERQLGEGSSGLNLSADRRTAVWSRVRTACLSEVVAHSFATGVTEAWANGTWPAISPDNAQLAYASDPNCEGQDRLVLRDLASGAERTLEAGSAQVTLRSISWAPDSRLVAFEVNRDGRNEIGVVDVSSAASLNDATWMRAGPDLQWTSPRFDQNGNVAIAEAGSKTIEGFSVVVVDPRSGTVLRRASAGSNAVLGMTIAPTAPGPSTRTPDPGGFLVVTDDGTIRLITDTIFDVARGHYLAIAS